MGRGMRLATWPKRGIPLAYLCRVEQMATQGRGVGGSEETAALGIPRRAQNARTEGRRTDFYVVSENPHTLTKIRGFTPHDCLSPSFALGACAPFQEVGKWAVLPCSWTAWRIQGGTTGREAYLLGDKNLSDKSIAVFTDEVRNVSQVCGAPSVLERAAPVGGDHRWHPPTNVSRVARRSVIFQREKAKYLKEKCRLWKTFAENAGRLDGRRG